MELGTHLKANRARLGLSQEALADLVYVSRQTISNWENDKSYPDIHSLLLLSNVFQVSLDQLIKGDVEQMKEEINKAEIDRFNRWGNIFSVLLVASIVSAVPLFSVPGWIGVVIWAVLFAVTTAVGSHVERLKKENRIFTYKEIVAFTRGKRLDELDSAREEGKRPYQRVLLAVGCGLITLVVALGMAALIRLLTGG